jgi:hypothetical protein
VLKLVAEAHTSEQIAELLTIGPRTVERHRENLMGKLGMRDRVRPYRHGLAGHSVGLSPTRRRAMGFLREAYHPEPAPTDVA